MLLFSFPGLQALLPQYLRVKFVRAALSYISCNSQGRMECQGGECWCHCDPAYPQCNCPAEDIHILEKSLTQTQEQAAGQNKEYEESGKLHCTATSYFARIKGSALVNYHINYIQKAGERVET